jgi:hypothetical protein
MSGKTTNKVVEKLKFEASFRVKANGKSQGLWLL